jgi:hypothetical protein
MDEVRVYRADHHRFFDDLFSLLVTYISFGCAVQAYKGGDPTLRSSKRVRLQGRVVGTDLEIPPDEIISPILEDRRPEVIQFIDLGFHPAWSRGDGSRSPQEPKRALAPAFRAAFVHYYESVLPLIVERWGRHRAHWHQWPDVLRFGAAVRDDFVHGRPFGKPKPGAPSSTWYGLVHDPANTPDKVFVMFEDLMEADVVFLMEEMDDAIPR